MPRPRINLDELMWQSSPVVQLIKIISDHKIIPLGFRIMDPDEKWSVTFRIDDYGKYGRDK
jgi:hypothetical protein